MRLMYLLIFVIGLCVGSFLNCLLWRLRQEKTICGRSICPHCGYKIPWHDNIPLISFAVLKGRCRNCNKKISWQYPAVELTTGILFLLAVFNIKHSIFSIEYLILILRNLIFVSALIVIFIYDLKWYLILDRITLPAMAAAIIINLFLGYSWQNLLAAGIIGGGFFLLQYVVSQGRWIGGGDIRLGALMGFMLGYPQVLVALALAYFSGAAVGVVLLVIKKKNWDSQIPFGTFLSAAAVATLLYGEQILEWYFSLLF